MGTGNTLSQLLSLRLSGPLDVSQILTTAGFTVRRGRGTCPYCHEGHRPPDLTVAIHGNLYFCHRCHRGGSVRRLARTQGIHVSPRRQGLARLRRMFFESWLRQKMTELSKEEFRLTRKACLAHIALTFPELREDFQPAWSVLATFAEREHVFERFWFLATDRLGRVHLYKYWRRFVADRTTT